MQVRTRRKVSEHRKAQMGTGGGTVPDLELTPWEVGCLSLMDNTAMEGVGVADHGSEDTTEEGASGSTTQQVVQTPEPPLTSTPTPRRAGETDRTPQQPHQTSAILSGNSDNSVHEACLAPTEPGEEAEEEEETVTLTLDEIPQTPPTDNESELMGDEDVVASPNEYDVPEAPAADQEDTVVPGSTGFEVLQSILQRLSALENTEAEPSANDTLMGQALVKIASASTTQTAALQGVQRLLVRSDKARKAEVKRSETALTILSTSVGALTEQLRLSSDKIATAISEQTVALRQMLASAATQEGVRASSASSPTHSSDTPSTSMSPTPMRGIRRQRGGRRGRQ